MKTPCVAFLSLISAGVRSGKRLALATVVLGTVLLSGCASNLGRVSKLPALPDSVRKNLGGTIGVSIPEGAASFGFDKASGRIATAFDGAGDGMLAVARGGGGSGEGAIVVLALLPVGALVGAVAETTRTVSPEELRRAETELRTGMAVASSQAELKDAVLTVARERTNLKLESAGPKFSNGKQSGRTAWDGRSEWRVELATVDLRLERTGLSGAAYALVIKARVRVMRREDGAVAYDAPIEFRSATSPFVDWSCDRGTGVRRTADYGYRLLAEEIVARLLAS